MKKLLVFALLATMMAACSVNSSEIDGLDASAQTLTTGQANTPVQLFRSSSYIHTKYGQSQLGLTWEVRVKNLAYNKSVFVRQLLKSGQWTNIALTYSRNADSGYEIWTGSVSQLNNYTYDTKFAVGYTVNGTTYWDNNNGANYTMPYNCGEMLGRGYQVAVKSYSYDQKFLSVWVDVRNIAYTKSVKLVYSIDNWATSTTVPLYFQSTYSYGYATVSCPTAAGFERWAAWNNYLGPLSNGKFFIEYTVNGVKYYDNNWGANYNM